MMVMASSLRWARGNCSRWSKLMHASDGLKNLLAIPKLPWCANSKSWELDVLPLMHLLYLPSSNGVMWRKGRPWRRRTDVWLHHFEIWKNFGRETHRDIEVNVQVVPNRYWNGGQRFLGQIFPRSDELRFTAKVEKEFDDIAEGELEWQKCIDTFIGHFIRLWWISKTQRKIPGKGYWERIQKARNPLSWMAASDPWHKLVLRAKKRKNHSLHRWNTDNTSNITLEEALKLFDLPRTLGDFESKTVVVGVGRFGPYIRHDGKFISWKKVSTILTRNRWKLLSRGFMRKKSRW